MKPHEQKKQERKRRRKQRAIKKPNKKGEKTKGQGKNLTKGNKRKEPKIKVLAHELLASTLSYLMLAPW
jgi:hypothetical protein